MPRKTRAPHGGNDRIVVQRAPQRKGTRTRPLASRVQSRGANTAAECFTPPAPFPLASSPPAFPGNKANDGQWGAGEGGKRCGRLRVCVRGRGSPSTRTSRDGESRGGHPRLEAPRPLTHTHRCAGEGGAEGAKRPQRHPPRWPRHPIPHPPAQPAPPPSLTPLLPLTVVQALFQCEAEDADARREGGDAAQRLSNGSHGGKGGNVAKTSALAGHGELPRRRSSSVETQGRHSVTHTPCASTVARARQHRKTQRQTAHTT